MKRLTTFVYQSIRGAIWFLFPLVVFGVLLGKAHQVAGRIVKPLADLMPVDSVFGMGVARILAVIALVLFCFLASLFSKTRLARKFIDWLEHVMLEKLPGYGLLKSIAASFGGVEEQDTQHVVLARIEDALQIGFITETLDNGLSAVYIPGAPTPWSGDVYFMTEDRFQRLDVSYGTALKCLRQLGRGSKVLLAKKKKVE